MSIKSSLGRQFGTQFDTVFDVVKSNPIYDKAGGSIPSLDLNFAQTKSLFDSRSVKNLITFSRASKGTYVGADGFIKLTSENLYDSSELMSTANAGADVTVTSSSVVTPFNNTNAAEVTENTDLDDHFYSVNFTCTSGASTVFSVYAKLGTGTRRFLLRGLSGTYGVLCDGLFDLENGTVISSNNANVSIEDAGNGWYRCIVAPTVLTTSTSGSLRLYLVDVTQTIYTGDGSSSILLYGAQVEEDTSTISDYIPTNGTPSGPPRFDHDPATGESLGLLIEEARTNLINQSEDFSARNFNNLTLSTDGAITAPDGTTGSVQLFTEDTSTGVVHRFFQSTISGNIPCAHSIFVKRASGTRYVYLSSDNSSGVRQIITFDIEAGTFQTTSSDFSNAFVQPYPNGWYRIGATITDDGVGGSLDIWGLSDTVGNLNYDGDGTSGFYFWGNQMDVVTVNSAGAEFASSYIPTSGTAVIRRADVAEITGADFAKTNLLTYSERLDQSIWTLSPGATVTPNAETAPDGTFTADLIDVVTGNTSGGSDIEQQINPFLADGTPCVFSFYIKSFAGQGSQTLYAKMGRNNTTSSYPFTATETWQRITVVDPGNTIGNTKGLFGIAAGLSGTPTAKFYLWGAQLEEGSVPTDYTPSVESFVSRASSATYVDDTTGLITTAAVDTARYENGDLLLEEARTNLSTYSEDLTFWAASNSTKTFDSSVTAPDGSSGAWVGAVNGTGVSCRIQPPSVPYTAGLPYTISVFCKAKGVNTVAVFFNSPDFGYFGSGASVDLTTGTSNASGLIVTPFPNGWYRISITSTPSSSGTNRTLCITPGSINDVNNVSGNGVDGVYIWGAQVEEGAFPTSYIPTTSSSVTRAADVSTSALGVDSFYNQSEGTMFGDVYRQFPVDSSDFPGIFYATDGTEDNRTVINYLTESLAGQLVNTGGVSQVNHYPTGLTGIRRRKVAARFEQDDFYAIANGLVANAKSDTSGTMPSNIDQVAIGSNRLGSYKLNGTIRRISYWPTGLSNSNLQSITN